MTTPETILVRRRCTPDEATLMVGDFVPERTPTFTGPTLARDADTGALVAAYLPYSPQPRLRRLLPTMGFTGVQRAKNYRSKSQTFGYAPRRPIFGREACALTEVASSRPELEGLLEQLADECGRTLTDVAPEIVDTDRATLDGTVLPEWRLGEEKMWTSGVVNKTAQLPYHRDGFNFPVWSAMPVFRRGARGGHLHLPEYDLVIPCGDGYASYFKGYELVHGVTPIEKRADDAYRYSVVFYALRGMKDCYTHAVETARGQKKRTAREAAMAKRLAAGDRDIPGRAR